MLLACHEHILDHIDKESGVFNGNQHKPTLSVEPIKRQTRMEEVSVVKALPIEEPSCPTQSSVNERFRKTENIDSLILPAMHSLLV
jgi:hypothetical protein